MPAHPGLLERKQVVLQDVGLNSDHSGSFGGYASVYDGVDSYGDTIVKGAYEKTIANFLTHGFIGWSHDDSQPVAYPVRAYEDDHGLFIEAAFHGTPEAQKARQIAQERLAAGKSMGLSIGYYPVKSEPGPDGTRRLLEIDLVETSLVMVPADAAARVSAVKQANRDEESTEEPDESTEDPGNDGEAPEPSNDDEAAPAPCTCPQHVAASAAVIASTCGHGTPWEEHTQTVLDALQKASAEVEAIYIRALAQDNLERKEGRRLSTETRAQLQQCLDVRTSLGTAFDVIEQLLADTAPRPKGYVPRHKLLALRLGLASVSATE